MRQLLVFDIHLSPAAKRLCSIAAVPGRRWRVVIRLRSGFRVFRLLQHRGPQRQVFVAGVEHLAGLLRIAPPHQHRRQSVQRVFELVVIGLAQRRFSRSVQHPIQFLKVHVDAAPGLLHATPPSSSRKRFVNG